jgi:outer membrane biogenesis lipoprotein LolB
LVRYSLNPRESIQKMIRLFVSTLTSFLLSAGPLQHRTRQNESDAKRDREAYVSNIYKYYIAYKLAVEEIQEKEKIKKATSR